MVKDKVWHMVQTRQKAKRAKLHQQPGRMALLAAAIAFASVPAMAQSAAPAAARPLTAVEIFMLVKDRTWQWSEGAGRFFDKDRRFIAFTRGKDGATYGEGRFSLTDGGRLCLVAVWHSAAGPSNARTCFLHKKANGVIYQRREGGGDWYPFMHTPLQETDEYAKFTAQDLVTGELARVKAELDAKGPVQKGN